MEVFKVFLEPNTQSFFDELIYEHKNWWMHTWMKREREEKFLCSILSSLDELLKIKFKAVNYTT